jgi:hypothetical protein
VTEQQLIRLESKEWLRKEPGPHSLAFSNKAVNPLISSRFGQHYFHPALLAAGLACRVHDLRHTSIAPAIAEGAPEGNPDGIGHSSAARGGPSRLSWLGHTMKRSFIQQEQP